MVCPEAWKYTPRKFGTFRLRVAEGVPKILRFACAGGNTAFWVPGNTIHHALLDGILMAVIDIVL